jgi:hypothetical protein
MNGRARVGFAVVGLCGLMLMGGCLSDDPGSRSLAYVNIDSSNEDAVRREVIRVLEDEGYALMESDDKLVFEREATRRDKVYFGQYGVDRQDMRVIVSIEPGRHGGWLVRSDAYVVRDGREEALRPIARRPYQKQLNRVKASMVSVGDS